ncbi:MAG: GNAT family N-acetyltransferase [Thermoproteales archaeon]|nr:GNAT family N-acetyltransferase [Thermoproteales archaeon]
MKVRKMTFKDLYYVLRICNSAFLEMARWTSRIAPAIIESMEKYPELQLVAEHDGKIVGFLRGGYKEDSLKILHIAVSPSFQGKGIGSKLLEEFESIAVKKGFRKITLDTPFAKRFYEKNGYKCVKIEYALIFETIGKELMDVKNTEIMKLSNISMLIERFGRDAYSFLKEYFKTFDTSSDKAFIYFDDDKVAGSIVGSINRWCTDLLEIRSILYNDERIKWKLIDKIIFEASLSGIRWIGYKTYKKEEYKSLLSEGWKESKLPYWWTKYFMEKEI